MLPQYQRSVVVGQFVCLALCVFLLYVLDSRHGQFRDTLLPPGADENSRIAMYGEYSKTRSHWARMTLRAETIIGKTHSQELDWISKPLPLVYMSMENSVHYDLDSDAEWSMTWPSQDAVTIPMNTRNESYTFSMIHQLRCLDIVRSSLVLFRSPEKTKPGALAEHCMNYLRQMVLCRADITLESARDPIGPNIVVGDITHVCRDWGVVWEKLEQA